MKHYQHLTTCERVTLMLELESGASIRKVARRLNRSPSTLSREIRRNDFTKTNYQAQSSELAYRRRRKHSRKPLKLKENPQLCDTVEQYLITKKWSPEQISSYLKRSNINDSMQVSHETIYAYIYAYPKGELRKLMVGSLRRSKSKRGPRGSKDSCYSSLKISSEQLIENRPEHINSREIAGH